MKMYHEASIRADYRALTKYLVEKNMTITTMESCTSGQIASLITDTEGSSSIIKGAFVTYSNEMKVMMGVPAEVIDTYTVYSEETAKAMAEICRAKLGADIGIGVTGSMGNIDPANAEASVPGQVYFAISYKNQERFGVLDAAWPSTLCSPTGHACDPAGGYIVNGGRDHHVHDVSVDRESSGNGDPMVEPEIITCTYHVELEPQESRLMYKLAVAKEIYEELMKII